MSYRLFGVLGMTFLVYSCNPCGEILWNSLTFASQDDLEDYEDFIKECDLSEIRIWFESPENEDNWNLSCFADVTIIGSIGNIPNGQVHHFSKLQYVESLSLGSNEVAYFPSLTKAGWITGGGDVLREIKMPALESVEYFSIGGSKNLGSISDMSSLEYAGSINIAGCESLRDISGFTALKQLGPHRNHSIISLSIWPDRKDVFVGESFQQLQYVDEFHYAFVPEGGDISWLAGIDTARLIFLVGEQFKKEDVCNVKNKLVAGDIKMEWALPSGRLNTDGIIALCD
jgi:hypothetical protein